MKNLMGACILGVVLAAGSVSAVTYAFTGGAGDGGKWESRDNWSPTGIPTGPLDTARFSTATVIGYLTNDWTCQYLKIGESGGGTLVIDGATLTLTGTDWFSVGYNRGNNKLTLKNGAKIQSSGRAMVGRNSLRPCTLVINDSEVYLASRMDLVPDALGSDPCLDNQIIVQPGGVLNCSQLNIYYGRLDLAGGKVIIRSATAPTQAQVDSWISTGRVITYGGEPGYYVSAVFGESTITLEALPEPTVIRNLGINVITSP